MRADVTDEHGRAGHHPCEHERLVSAPVEIGADVLAVADDDHALLVPPAPIATAQNRRPLAGLDQQSCDMGGDRRLSPPAHRDVADAEDGRAVLGRGPGF